MQDMNRCKTSKLDVLLSKAIATPRACRLSKPPLIMHNNISDTAAAALRPNQTDKVMMTAQLRQFLFRHLGFESNHCPWSMWKGKALIHQSQLFRFISSLYTAQEAVNGAE